MGEFLQLAIAIGCVALPFVAMPLLWRRMKKVRAQSYAAREQEPQQQPWEEATHGTEGLNVGRRSNPNDELIALGEHARQSRWPINNP